MMEALVFRASRTRLFDKLVVLACGDIDLVQEAIRRSSEKPGEPSRLEKVVEYIVARRHSVPRNFTCPDASRAASHK